MVKATGFSTYAYWVGIFHVSSLKISFDHVLWHEVALKNLYSDKSPWNAGAAGRDTAL